jgi:type VI secretion system protein ImpJ
MELIKLAELARDAGGVPRLVGTYAAPALWLAAAPALRSGIARVLEACLLKRRAVRAELRHRDAVSVEFSADEVTRYLALHVVSGAIPVLEHLLADASTSPSRAHTALLQLEGQLTTFSAEDELAPMPRFAHDDLRASFEPLIAQLLSLLQVAVHSRTLCVGLESRVDGLHLARLAQSELQQPGARFVLAVQAALPEHEVGELLPRVAKIASWSEIQRYLSAAVSTVALKLATRPPREIPLRPGKHYFTVDAAAPLFRAALRERALALHLPPPFAPETTHVELFAILPG